MEYFGFETGAFSQLTQDYMKTSFNERTPDVPDVKYFSYGASLEPNKWSVFAASHAIVKRTEGLNDGLVRFVITFPQHNFTLTSGQHPIEPMGRL
jgi:triacylglycerol lipase